MKRMLATWVARRCDGAYESCNLSYVHTLYFTPIIVPCRFPRSDCLTQCSQRLPTIHYIAHLQYFHYLFLQQARLCAKKHEWCTQSFKSSVMAYGALPCHLCITLIEMQLHGLQQPYGYVKLMLAIMISKKLDGRRQIRQHCRLPW